MRKPKVALVADDNRIERMILSEAFSGFGIEVVEAADGEAAVELAIASHADVVVSDVLMPKADGFAVSIRLREADPDPRPVIILLSAVYKGAKWKHEALTTCGADEYLTKPLKAEDLEQILRKYFDLD
jgi:sigma-B regulation protein RsbU (phosphoserine phosphatase)